MIRQVVCAIINGSINSPMHRRRPLFRMEATMAFIALLVVFLIRGTDATTFEFSNHCPFTVWVGALSGAGTPALPQSGFELPPSASNSLPAPAAWSGRFWARTHCSTDQSGAFSCATGDCATGEVPCDGLGAEPPATLVEVTLGGGAGGGDDFYDVSLVDGYNVPASVGPAGGGVGDCRVASCPGDVNALCPPELSVAGPGGAGTVACRSACEAFGDPKYCCTGEFGSPAACQPTAYSMLFKSACPSAYSYAYDDATSTFTCAAAAGYAITFCP